MAQHIVRDERGMKAQGIVERQETHLRDDGTWQCRDAGTGSGRWYIVLDGHCSCPDYVYRHMTCKHLRATFAEERILADYCRQWNAESDAGRQVLRCHTCGSAGEALMAHLGGHGTVTWLLCTADSTHPARRLT